MSKITIKINEIRDALQNIGYVISDCIERENNGINWQIKFHNSGAIVTIYDTNTKKNTVVNGKAELDERTFLKSIIDDIKCKEIVIDPLNKTIVDLVNSKKEDFYYDFKRCFTENKEDLLHDILCLSNNLENRDAYLIIGVTDTYEVTGVDDNFTSNDLFDFLRSKDFAGNHIPDVEFKFLYYKQHKVAVIVCKKSQNVPFYLAKKYKSIFANQIYTRIGDTNTPKTENASYTDIEKLWKFHFLIND